MMGGKASLIPNLSHHRKTSDKKLEEETDNEAKVILYYSATEHIFEFLITTKCGV